MDRGFELMIPKQREVRRKYNFRQSIRFSLFGKEFHLYFSVKPTQE